MASKFKEVEKHKSSIAKAVASGDPNNRSSLLISSPPRLRVG